MRSSSIPILYAPLALVAFSSFASAETTRRDPASRVKEIPVRYMDLIVSDTPGSLTDAMAPSETSAMAFDRNTRKAIEIQDAHHGCAP